MTSVPSRELRNHTADVLGRVRSGEDVTITVNGEPVAVMVSARATRRRQLSRTEFLHRFRQADSGLRVDLDRLAGDSTDDLGPIR